MGRKNRRKKTYEKKRKKQYQANRYEMNRRIVEEEKKKKAEQERKSPRRMEIWHASLEMREESSVQGGNRPVLIVSNNDANRHASTVTVLPLTGKLKKLNLPSHCPVYWRGQTSVVLAEQITTIDIGTLDEKLGEITDEETRKKIERAMKAQLDLEEDYEQDNYM